jgi:hypothetical protein
VSFLYSLLNFLQPGILWSEIAWLRPMLVASVLGLLVGVFRGAEYPRQAAFSHPIFVWLVAFILAQILSVYYGGFSGMLEEFSFWSVYLMFVVISILLISNTVALKRYVWGMIVGSMVVVGYGIYGVYAWGGYTLENGIATGRAGAYGMYENHNDYTFIIHHHPDPAVHLYVQAC